MAERCSLNSLLAPRRRAELRRRHGLPSHVWQWATTALHSDMSDDECAKSFVIHLHGKRIRGNYADRLFRTVKPLLFPTTTVRVDTLHFDKTAANSQQVRLESSASTRAYIAYLEKRRDRDARVLPLLMLAYTGLRASEVLRMTVATLRSMHERVASVDLRLKGGVDTWRPAYTQPLVSYVQYLVREVFQRELAAVEAPLLATQRLFPICARTLQSNMTQLYVSCFGRAPPLGMGPHMFRYYRATTARNIDTAQRILSHAKKSTTQRYRKADPTLVNVYLTEANTSGSLMCDTSKETVHDLHDTLSAVLRV